MRKTTDSAEIFASAPIGTALRTMAIPTIFSQIIVLIYNMADTFFVGKVNDPNMVAATSLILPVFNICIPLASLTGVGGGTLISRLLGNDRPEEAKKVGSFSIYIAFGVSLLFSVAVGVFMTPLLTLLGADDSTRLFAGQYALWVIVIGGVPTVLSNVFSNLLRSVGRSKAAGFGITLGGLLNIILDPLFMFVLLPRGQEVLGVGIATCISNYLACLYFIIVILRTRKQSILTLRPNTGRPESASIRSIFNVGLPSAIAFLLFDLDYMVIDKLMVGYGSVALAAMGIVLKVERLPLNTGIGLCQGMMPIIAYNYAAKNKERMDGTIRCARKVGLLIAAISIVLYEIFAPYIMRVFIPDPLTVTRGTEFLRIRILATPLMFLCFFTVHVFQAVGRGDKALFLGVMRWVVFNIPMLYLLNRIIGMYGLAISQIAADILTVILSVFVYRRYERRSGLKDTQSL